MPESDLRDMFAASALAKLADGPDFRLMEGDGEDARRHAARIAADCYRLADAMILARRTDDGSTKVVSESAR